MTAARMSTSTRELIESHMNGYILDNQQEIKRAKNLICSADSPLSTEQIEQLAVTNARANAAYFVLQSISGDPADAQPMLRRLIENAMVNDVHKAFLVTCLEAQNLLNEG